MQPEIPEDLRDRLLGWCRGLPHIEPAVRLLVVHPLVAEAEFVTACIVVVDDDTAIVDWSAVRDFVEAHPEIDDDTRRTLQLAYLTARAAWSEATPADPGIGR